MFVCHASSRFTFIQKQSSKNYKDYINDHNTTIRHKTLSSLLFFTFRDDKNKEQIFSHYIVYMQRKSPFSIMRRVTERDIYVDDFTLREGDKATPSKNLKKSFINVTFEPFMTFKCFSSLIQIKRSARDGYKEVDEE